MENDNITYRIVENIPDQKIFQTLENIYTSIFEDADIPFFRNRFKKQEELLSIIALDNQKIVGFKVGYRYNTTTFYSWVGGVITDYRKKGIATKLAKLQEEFAKERGYTKLRTKSMNRFKPMMLLNLKNGFNIVQVYTNEKEQTKIVFEKDLFG